MKWSTTYLIEYSIIASSEWFRSLTLPKSIIYDFKTLADIDVHFWHSRPDKDVVLHLSSPKCWITFFVSPLLFPNKNLIFKGTCMQKV